MLLTKVLVQMDSFLGTPIEAEFCSWAGVGQQLEVCEKRQKLENKGTTSTWLSCETSWCLFSWSILSNGKNKYANTQLESKHNDLKPTMVGSLMSD